MTRVEDNSGCDTTDFGCVLRDHSSKVIRAMYDPLGVCDSILAEAMGLLTGPRELKQLVVIGCMVEGDSEVVISSGLGHGRGSWHQFSTLYKIGELVDALSVSLMLLGVKMF